MFKAWISHTKHEETMVTYDEETRTVKFKSRSGKSGTWSKFESLHHIPIQLIIELGIAANMEINYDIKRAPCYAAQKCKQHKEIHGHRYKAPKRWDVTE